MQIDRGQLRRLTRPAQLGKPLELKAPIDGIITERQATVGELAGKETQIYTTSDPTDFWVVAEVKERDIGAVRLGANATFTVLAYPNETFRGKVVRVGNRVESVSRTLDARIAVQNEDGRLTPGMFADVEIAITAVEDARHCKATRKAGWCSSPSTTRSSKSVRSKQAWNNTVACRCSTV